MSALATARLLAEPRRLRAALYVRISFDKKKDRHGVERDERLVRRRCDELGFSLDERHVFVDNSRSAWKRNRQRPGWDALIAAVDTGEVDVILCADPDRLMRQPRDLETLIEIAERGVRVIGKVDGYDCRARRTGSTFEC